MFQNLAVNFVIAHKQYFIGIALGIALAHIPDLVLVAFHLAMKVPWIRTAVLSNPEKSKALIDQISKELEKDIDEEVKSNAPKAQ